MPASLDEIAKRIGEYISELCAELEKPLRPIPSYKDLSATHTSTMEAMSNYLGDLNDLASLYFQVTVKKTQLRILQQEAELLINIRQSKGKKNVDFYMSRLYDMERAIKEKKQHIETCIECIRSIQSANVSYQRIGAHGGRAHDS